MNSTIFNLSYCMTNLRWCGYLCLCFFGFVAQGIGQSCQTAHLTHYQFYDIKNILEKNNCQSCHNNTNTNVPWRFDTYRDITAKGKCGPIIDYGSPQTSLLIDKLNQGSSACGYSMPLGGNPMSSRDLLAIETWILVGAPEFCIPTFEEVKEILTVNQCQQCHNTTQQWRFDKFENIFLKTNQSVCSQQNVIPFKAGESLLYQKISGEHLVCGEKMMNQNQPVSDEHISRIRDWINAGSLLSSPSLPVILTDFSAELNHDQSVLLYWQSSAEYNTSYYVVENSGDGIHFDEVGVRDAKSISSELTNYEFLDLVHGFGNQYYRLKIVDADGQYSYSPTRAVRIKNSEETLRIYPNVFPTNHTIQVEWLPANDDDITKIQFMDIMGKIVHSSIISPGINLTVMPQLSPGVYYAVIPQDTENYLIKKMVMIY